MSLYLDMVVSVILGMLGGFSYMDEKYDRMTLAIVALIFLSVSEGLRG